MTDQTDASALVPGVPAPARPQSTAEWLLAEAVAALKELAPYVLVGMALVEVSGPVKMSDFGIHVFDMVLGAALMAINPGARK
jgi:hypothetical protein